MNVKNIDKKDEDRMIQELKDLNKPEIVNYIRALKQLIKSQKYTIQLAIKKIKELSKE